jgi:hypothetical protein
MRVSSQCVPWSQVCPLRVPGTHDLSVSPCPRPLGGGHGTPQHRGYLHRIKVQSNWDTLAKHLTPRLGGV